MVKPYVTTFTAWSYSRLSAWEDCPLRAKLKLLDKRKEPEGPALARGNAIHKEAEAYAIGVDKKLSPNLVQFADDFRVLKKAKPMVEQQWAFTKAWDPTSWFEPDVWLRVVCDVVVIEPQPKGQTTQTAVVIDHKTGKFRDGYKEQVELFALATMARYPAITDVRTELWYLDHGIKDTNDFDKTMEPKLRKKWEGRARPMLIDKTFAAKPGSHCRWCDFSKHKQGLCKW